MKGAANSVTISVLGKEFMVACPDDERNALLDAARLLTARCARSKTAARS